MLPRFGRSPSWHIRFGVTVVVVLAIVATAATAAPQAELWPRWEVHDPDSTETVDHGEWAEFLDRYLVTDHSSGVYRVRYDDVTPTDRRRLRDYVRRLQAVAVSRLNRDEQLAYWINLYNAATVDLILEHYPVDSIRDIGDGLLSRGPWDDELLEVEGEALTLNDVEHRIIRPIWEDERIHYVVNCASIGCPNLYPEPLTGENRHEVFDEAARDYINHRRGVRFEDDRLVLSEIYNWYTEDFGGDTDGVVRHLLEYLDEETAERLRSFDGRIRYEYDWALNEP